MAKNGTDGGRGSGGGPCRAGVESLEDEGGSGSGGGVAFEDGTAIFEDIFECDGVDVGENELLRECARGIFDGGELGVFEDADVGAGRVVIGGGVERKDDETDELWLKMFDNEFFVGFIVGDVEPGDDVERLCKLGTVEDGAEAH